MISRLALVGFSLTLVFSFSGTGCSSSQNRIPISLSKNHLFPTGKISHGKASYYSTRCNGGTQTASGEPLRNNARTAAHKSLPFGTRVRVTNMKNGRSEIVRITDRGPYKRGRIIDVTIGVAKQLDMVTAGVVPVKVEVLRQG